MMRLLSALAVSFAVSAAIAQQPVKPRGDESPIEKPIDVPIAELGTKFRLLGKLHEPIGSLVKIQGVVVAGPFKGYEGGPNVRVQRINGRATQEHIQLPLSPYFNEKPAVQAGRTYEWEGYESGGFMGIPTEAYERAGLILQSSGYYFRLSFTMVTAKEIPALSFSPSDFVSRRALLGGRAENREGRASIAGRDWRLVVSEPATWPPGVEGKEVEGLGTIRKAPTPGVFTLDEGTTRLVRLADQLGNRVALRGRVRSVNGHYWFNYRGTNLYVENLEQLIEKQEPAARLGLHYGAGEVRGTLDEAMLPAVDQISFKTNPDLKKYFIVRRASCEPSDPLLLTELGD